MDLPEPYEKNSDDEANRCEGEEMRKPTREEVVAALTCSSVMATVADAVMALFEDKPKPKWEEDLSTYVKRNGLKSYDSECVTLHAEGLKDFIRKKLREMYEDCKETNSCRSIVDVKAKWGL